ncbi:MAG: hypothetical protein ACLSUW_02125 [Akkermansia sp.]
MNINPNRANRYLMNWKNGVSAWLPYTDATAHEALKNPVFRLKLILQSYKEAAPCSQSGSSDITLPRTGNGGQSHHAGNRPGGGRIQQILLRQSKYNPELFILNMDAVRLSAPAFRKTTNHSSRMSKIELHTAISFLDGILRGSHSDAPRPERPSTGKRGTFQVAAAVDWQKGHSCGLETGADPLLFTTAFSGSPCSPLPASPTGS